MTQHVPRRRTRRFVTIATLTVAFGIAGILAMPTTTRQGVDFTVSVRQLPLYLKALSFVDRHCQYRHLARQVTVGLSSDRERVLRLFEWTRQQVRPTPPGFPIVDDHILHIIIRGYGEPDQMADVFTTLATYAGIPAFWEAVQRDEGPGRLVFSFAKVDGRWAVFDVAHGVVFTDPHGRFLDVQDLLTHPEFVEASVGTRAPHGIPYQQYLQQLRPLEVAPILRAQKQMPWPRLLYEVQLRLHLIEDAEARQRHTQPSLMTGAKP